MTFMKVTEGTGLPVPGAMGQGLMLPTGQEADQENRVPATVELSVIGVKAVPEQMDCPAEHDITGLGLTGRVSPAIDPEHPFA